MTKQHTSKIHYFIGGGNVACGKAEAKVEMATYNVTKVSCESCRRVSGIPTHKSEYQEWLRRGTKQEAR